MQNTVIFLSVNIHVYFFFVSETVVTFLKTSCIHQNEVAFFKLVPSLVQVDTVFAL